MSDLEIYTTNLFRGLTIPKAWSPDTTGTIKTDPHGRDPSQGLKMLSGKLVWPMDFQSIDFDLDDVIMGISRQNRFVGQTTIPVNVCWHSLNLSYVVPEHLKLPALVHDITEAYLVDIPRPLKNHPAFAFFSVAEDELFARMAATMNLPFTILPKDLHKYDVDIGNAEMIMFNQTGHRARMQMGFPLDKERDAMALVKKVYMLMDTGMVPNPVDVEATRKAWKARYAELFPQHV